MRDGVNQSEIRTPAREMICAFKLASLLSSTRRPMETQEIDRGQRSARQHAVARSGGSISMYPCNHKTRGRPEQWVSDDHRCVTGDHSVNSAWLTERSQ